MQASSSRTAEGDTDELEQLRATVAFLTTQCSQLDEANRAWQQYSHSQIEDFRSKLQDYVTSDNNMSLDSVAQQIIELISKEREEFKIKCETLEKELDNLRAGRVTFIV